ncbi:MAG: hypothetical protein MRERV_7c037 [Mycoplasmataceae bacterium RV_VA103A]|nr:MAG: hypothetical protein MRERV_7c037 [Mycoplasmataceae bacterium RV_VA103A]
MTEELSKPLRCRACHQAKERLGVLTKPSLMIIKQVVIV